MLLDLLDGSSQVWIDYKDALEEIFALFRDILWPSYIEVENIIKRLLYAITSEGVETTYHLAKHHSPRPDVTFKAIP